MIKLQNNLELNFICGGMFVSISVPVIKRAMTERQAVEFSSTTPSDYIDGNHAPLPTPVPDGEFSFQDLEQRLLLKK